MRVPTDQAHPVRVEVQPGLWLDSRRAVWFASLRMLVLADLHWGYATSHRARGNLLPAWGDEEIAQGIEALVADYQPVEMVWLGDTIHAAEGAGAAERFLLTCGIQTTVVAGNHDRRWRRAMVPSVVRGRFLLHHGDATQPNPHSLTEVIGHHHPAVSWSDGAGGNVKVPALICDPQRIVLPAFSPWASGTNCSELLTPHSQLWAIASKRIFCARRSERAPVSL